MVLGSAPGPPAEADSPASSALVVPVRRASRAVIWSASRASLTVCASVGVSASSGAGCGEAGSSGEGACASLDEAEAVSSAGAASSLASLRFCFRRAAIWSVRSGAVSFGSAGVSGKHCLGGVCTGLLLWGGRSGAVLLCGTLVGVLHCGLLRRRGFLRLCRFCMAVQRFQRDRRFIESGLVGKSAREYRHNNCFYGSARIWGECAPARYSVRKIRRRIDSE